ncbi:MAG: hypothetical protein DDT42_01404 [candidate division WS2 bacterium]|uniref:Uncharacterized protein n=1 Tax=Psychracetigena formicireducens TaxID=2986056 RepID=A0A9E2BHB1_PSYF1|nr:hypothetical protein [Candidatus Psychracetigena formicireducens]
MLPEIIIARILIICGNPMFFVTLGTDPESPTPLLVMLNLIQHLLFLALKEETPCQARGDSFPLLEGSFFIIFPLLEGRGVRGGWYILTPHPALSLCLGEGKK